MIAGIKRRDAAGGEDLDLQTPEFRQQAVPEFRGPFRTVAVGNHEEFLRVLAEIVTDLIKEPVQRPFYAAVLAAENDLALNGLQGRDDLQLACQKGREPAETSVLLQKA